MKIREIYIAGFGKLKEMKMSFTDGINEILAENGYGKSTLAAFISAMLYGLDDTRSTKLDENPRKKYLPWDSVSFGGYMVFEEDGGLYRVERSFGKKATVAEDTFLLIDLKTGKETDKYTSKLGEEIFGIDEDGFLRTAYLSERSLSEKNTNPTVSAKLSNISLADADMGGYDNAEKLLEERRRFYQKRGGGGEIRDTESEASIFEAKIDELKEKQKKLPEYEDALSSLDEKIQTLRQRKASYKVTSDEIGEHEKKKMLLQRYKELSAKRDELLARERELLIYFGGKVPERNALESLSEARAGRAAAERMKASLPKEEIKPDAADTDIPDISYVEELSASFEKLPGASFASALGGALLTLAGIILAFINLGAGICVALLGLLLIFIGIYTYFSSIKRKISSVNDLLSELGEEELPEGSGKDAAKRRLRYIEKIIAEKERQKTEGLNEEKQRSSLIEKYDDEINRYKEAEEKAISGLGVSRDADIHEISAKLAELTLTSREAKLAKETAERFLQSNEVGTDIEIGAPDMTKEKLSFMLSGVDNELIDAERERVRIKSDYDALLAESERLPEYEARLLELRERISVFRDNLSIITKTEKMLALAKEQLTARYLGRARDAFERYVALFGNAGDYTLDTSFTLTKTELGKSRKTESFSKGTRELLSLAVRLALTDALFESGDCPIILDDPFTSFDDAHIQSAKEIMSRLAEGRQIIYLTCSESRSIKNNRK